MAGLSFHDRLHIQKILAQQGYLQSMFSEFIRKVSPELTKMAQTGNPNVWIRNARVEANIDRYLNDFTDELTRHITNIQSDAWARSTLKSDDLVKEYIKGMAIDSTTKQGMFNRNVEAFKTFANRTKNGITLSEQIWDIAKETKTQLEFYVGSGISVGRSATRISQDIRQLLNDPDTQFRRKRDENGKLVPSKPMKDYHPGQGVYKSPYKNAMRLAVTETNMAYRTADHERWNQLDFVTGVKIQRSGNGEPCKICDPLVGDYPKGFKFVGWHPHCICFATPIMLDQDDFLDFQLTDKIPESAIVTSIPKQAEEYINRIAPKIENWKNKPYWIKDNYVDGDVSKGFSFNAGVPNVKVVAPPSALDSVAKYLDDAKIEYKQVEYHSSPIGEEKIIERIGGGDLTKGSCSSLALAYAGNKCGFDVLDFRDGLSRKMFSSTRTIMDIAEKVGGKVCKHTNDFMNAKMLLKDVVEGKEYYFTCGAHAAIIRKMPTGYEYLELQSAFNNGFKSLTDVILKLRFGAKKSHSLNGIKYESRDCIIDIDLLKKDSGFRKILGYINTAENEQVKGIRGTIK